MEFLNRSFFFIIAMIFFSEVPVLAVVDFNTQLGDPSRKVIVPSYSVKDRNFLWEGTKHPDHCDSTKEFVEALSFMRTQKDVVSSESLAKEKAFEISKGCNGATQRFARIFLLLKKSGVDYSKSLHVGVLFSKESDTTVDNFFEIFQKTYLGEFFDLDYQTAINVSYELSTDFEGNREQARKDFLSIGRDCLDKNEMNLPIKQCAELALKFARNSKYFPEGTYKPFSEMYKLFRKDKRFGLSIRSTLEIINEILPYGPKAPENFISGFDLAIKENGMNLGGKDAITFGIAMAKRSVKTLPPPVYERIGYQYDQIKKK
jgi:hypothetical protein